MVKRSQERPLQVFPHCPDASICAAGQPRRLCCSQQTHPPVARCFAAEVKAFKHVGAFEDLWKLEAQRTHRVRRGKPR